MAVGFQTFNTAGALQFNAEQSILSFVRKQTFSGLGTFVATGAVNPVLVFTADGYAYIGTASISGSTWSFPVIGTNVTVYLFDHPTVSAAGSNYGMELFDGSGNKLYNAVDNKPFKPVAFYDSLSGVDWNLGIPSGRTYAVGYATPIYYTQETPGDIGHYDYMIGIASTSANVIHTSFGYIGDATSIGMLVGFFGRWVAVDVTAY